MTFNNSGKINAGVLNQVEGDLYNTGGQWAAGANTLALGAAADLRRVLTAMPAHRSTAGQIRQLLDEVDVGMKAPESEKGRVAGALERLTRLLSAVGAFVTGGAALIGPLQALARWLGPLGMPILHLL